MTTSIFIWIPLAICLSLASVSTRFAGAAWAWLLIAGLAALWTTRYATTRQPSLAHELARTWLIFTAVALALKTVPMLYWHDPWAERHAELRLFLGALGLYGLTRLSTLNQQATRYLAIAGIIFCALGMWTLLIHGRSSTPSNPIPWAAGMSLMTCWLLSFAFSQSTSWRWLWLLGSLLGLLTVLTSETRGAYGLLIIWPLMFWRIYKREKTYHQRQHTRKTWPVFASISILAIASLWSIKNTPVIERPANAIRFAIEQINDSQSSLSKNYNSSVGARLYLWIRSAQAVVESPWIGYGHDQRLQLLRQWSDDTQLPAHNVYGHPHSDYFHTLLDHGLWGLASFLSYSAGLIFLIIKLRRKTAWTSSAALTGMLFMHLTTAISNVNFAHNYYPTLMSLMVCITLWSSAGPQTTKAP